MQKILIPILFALGTALCWGMYGPALGNARSMDKPPLWSPFKPYVFIGVAYLVIAIVGGLIAMKLKGDTFSYGDKHSPAMTWGFLAGSLGAAGALFLTNAVMASKGNTALVMPIVFGGAVTVNAVVSWLKFRNDVNTQISPVMWIGMWFVFQGVIMIAIYTPHGPSKPKTPTAQAETGSNDNPTAPSASASEGDA